MCFYAAKIYLGFDRRESMPSRVGRSEGPSSCVDLSILLFRTGDGNLCPLRRESSHPTFCIIQRHLVCGSTVGKAIRVMRDNRRVQRSSWDADLVMWFRRIHMLDSQSRFSARAGTSIRTISRLENSRGNYIPNRRLARRMDDLAFEFGFAPALHRAVISILRIYDDRAYHRSLMYAAREVHDGRNAGYPDEELRRMSIAAAFRELNSIDLQTILNPKGQ